ncbi:cupin domain-containing protein [Foetidibacter luteolus]|uniref:cupin domain-containing protein n=1 Tax=Foetidibacter luteolus TaxID=2608880 RepID=UPI00129BE975|nr:cupin domain-containing protein [Foetidibacter luteolus]
MAYKGKIIRNPKTGQTIEFVTTAEDSDGAFLEMVTSYAPHSKEPVAHYHPLQHEYFTVLEGALTIKKNGKIITLTRGMSIEIPKNTTHSMWNNGSAKTVLKWKVAPALSTEFFFETTMGLVSDNKTKADGNPCLLQVALLAKKYSKEFRLFKPSYAIQRIVFALLTPFALLAGKRAVYKKYIN